MGFVWYRKQRRLVSGFLIIFLILAMVSSPIIVVASEPSEPHQPNALWIEPSTVSVETQGERFNLTVWLNIAEECFAWQLKILFNSSYFNVSRLGYTDGAKSDFFSDHSTITVPPIIENIQGYVIAGETLLENDTRSSGYGSLLWIEFSLSTRPNQEQFDFVFSEPYGVDTFVLDPYLDTVTMDHVDGTVISIIQSNLIRDLLIMAAIIGVGLVVIIGFVKRKRVEKDE
jgi:hypothetical protein